MKNFYINKESDQFYIIGQTVKRGDKTIQIRLIYIDLGEMEMQVVNDNSEVSEYDDQVDEKQKREILGWMFELDLMEN